MFECDEPQTTSSSVGSKPRRALAVSLARWPYSAADLVADLPGAVHLVAETPEAAVPRFRAPVLGPEVGPVAAARVVDVFDEVARLVEAARAEIDREHHLGAGLFGPVGEFVDADQVRLRGAPGKVEPPRAAFLRADAVFPIVGGHEVAARIAADRRVELAHQLDARPCACPRRPPADVRARRCPCRPRGRDARERSRRDVCRYPRRHRPRSP